MKFVQLISFTTDRTPADLVDLEVDWREQTRGRRTNLVEWFLIDRADPRRMFAINGFADDDTAATNSHLPETDALARAIGDVIDDVTFVDCDFVDQAGAERERLAAGLTEALTSGKVPEGVFTDDFFLDINVPQWRYQLQGIEAFRKMLADDVAPSAIEAMQVTPTFEGFVVELSTRDPEHSYRQLCLVRTRGGLISEVTLYCTGPWDAATETRQRAEAPMIRPR